jgi:hypothetical protein
MAISIIFTIISWIISMIIGKAIIALAVGAVCTLVSIFIFAYVVKMSVAAFGVKITLYILGGVAAVLLVVGLFKSWTSAPEEPVNPTVYVHATEAIRGNAFTSPVGIFGRRSRTITLVGIGVPALDAAFGVDSKDYLNLLVADKSVAVVAPSGYRGDIEGIIETPEGWVAQQMMVRAGMAWCTGDQWRAEEKEARKSKRGIWAVYSFEELKMLIEDLERLETDAPEPVNNNNQQEVIYEG